MVRPSSADSTFGAIAHPTRRAVLNTLREGQRSASELRKVVAPHTVNPSQATFSEHLSVLSRAGLVHARPKGRERIYALNPGPLVEISDWLKPYEAFWDERLARLGDYLDGKAGTR